MKILITGASSHLARALLPSLCADPEISAITGVDLQPTTLNHPKYQHHQFDIRSEKLDELMPNQQAVIHMAFVVIPGWLKHRRHHRELIRELNVSASRHVFERCIAHRIPALIHLSSAVVYGAWADNPAIMDERQPLRAMTGFAYAEDKVAVEKILDELESVPHAPRIVRLRPHVILGSHAQPLLRNLLRQPCYPRLPDPQPLTQCVWEEDVCQAICLALKNSAHGAFNLAADPPLSFKSMIQYRHRYNFALSLAPLIRLHRLLWKFTGSAGEPGWVEGLQHALAIDSRRAREQLGWQPQKNSYQCLDSFR
ncbi:MAG: NAD-dependent epimerase/dehydratase family protein [Gammaproteobacteria bacterium]|nr:NAD-dependent epimerase/dehydratase family protein [Gammaproteobacteria bacterium]